MVLLLDKPEKRHGSENQKLHDGPPAQVESNGSKTDFPPTPFRPSTYGA
jgi:hypothetical protein